MQTLCTAIDNTVPTSTASSLSVVIRLHRCQPNGDIIDEGRRILSLHAAAVVFGRQDPAASAPRRAVHP